jgi:hypothetical protein
MAQAHSSDSNIPLSGAIIAWRPPRSKRLRISLNVVCASYSRRYLCLHLARIRPAVLTVRMSFEHHRVDYRPSAGAMQQTNRYFPHEKYATPECRVRGLNFRWRRLCNHSLLARSTAGKAVSLGTCTSDRGAGRSGAAHPRGRAWRLPNQISIRTVLGSLIAGIARSDFALRSEAS